MIEAIVILAIIILLSAISASVYLNLRSRSNLEIGVNSIVEALRYAKNNAEQVNSDSVWGIYADANQVTIFKGENYASRDLARDKTLVLPSGLNVSGIHQVVFKKISGETTDAGIITITNSNSNKIISINEKGTISY